MAAEQKSGKFSAQARRISRGGMLVTLIIFFIYIGGISPTANIALFSLTSLCVVIAVSDLKFRFGMTVFLAAAGISLAWPGLFAAWPFIFFFGPYPLWQYWMDLRFRGLAAWLGKSLFAHIFFWLAVPLFARSQLQQLSEQFGLAFWLGLPIIIQFIFMLYQYSLNLLYIYYRRRLPDQHKE